MSGGQTVRTPWHLWVVGILALLWNSFGCVDYFMTQTRKDEWFAQMGMTAAQVGVDDDRLSPRSGIGTGRASGATG